MAKRIAQKRKAVGLTAANERTPKVRQSDGLVPWRACVRESWKMNLLAGVQRRAGLFAFAQSV